MKRVIPILATLTVLTMSLPAGAAIPPTPAPAPQTPTPLQLKARAILANAAREHTSIETTLAGGVATVAWGALNANSTLDASRVITLGAQQYAANDAMKIDITGALIVSGTSGYVWSGETSNVSTQARGATNMQKLAFATDADAFELAGNFGTGAVMVYVTDVSTGVRSRIAANDFSDPAADFGNRHMKVTFTAPFGLGVQKVIEVFTSGGMFLRGINVTTGYTIWKASPQAYTRLCVIGDSWAAGALSSGTNAQTLNMMSYLGDALGTTAQMNVATGNTGILNDGGGTPGTFIQRLNLGDLAEANVGKCSLVVLFNTINDRVAVNAAYTDAAAQTAVQAVTAKLMTDQPGAIIAVVGPQDSKTYAYPASRFTALSAGVSAAANGDPRVLFIDNGPNGEGWYAAARVTAQLGSDGLHPNDIGKKQMGYRAAASILDRLRTLAGY